MTPRERAHEYFETPSHYIAALLSEVNIFGRIYEPCVGEWAIANALQKLPSVKSIHTNDIDRKRDAHDHKDACNVDAWGGKYDWAITNPPFSDELPILENALESVANVAFLARLSFLEPTADREYLLESQPPSQILVLPRYSFRPNDKGEKATDSVTCAWLVWMKDRQPRRTMAFGRGKSHALATIQGLIE